MAKAKNTGSAAARKTAVSPEEMQKDEGEPILYPPVRTPSKLEQTAIDVAGLIKSTLKNEINPEQAYVKNGKELLHDISVNDVFIGSGRNKPHEVNATIKGSPVYAMTLTEKLQPRGLRQVNLDAVVVAPGKEDVVWTEFLIHADRNKLGTAAAVNLTAATLAAQSVKNDERDQSKRLPQIFEKASNTVTENKSKFGMVKDDKIDVVGAILVKDPEHKSYRLKIANNGKGHCLVIDPGTGSFVSTPSGVRKPDGERAVDQPDIKDLWVGSNNYVVLASDALVKAFGSEDTLVEAIVNHIKSGSDVQDFGKFTHDLSERQKRGEISDVSRSMSIQKVPEYEGS